MWIEKFQLVLSSEILSITMGEDSLYIEIANMIKLQSLTSIVAWVCLHNWVVIWVVG